MLIRSETDNDDDDDNDDGDDECDGRDEVCNTGFVQKTRSKTLFR